VATTPTRGRAGSPRAGPRQEGIVVFNPIFDCLQKATETTIQMQEAMFKNWASLWPGLPASGPAGTEQVSNFQKKWVESMTELVRKQGEALEVQFRAGLRNLEDSFRLAEARDPEELRRKTVELWHKAFDSLRQCSEAQAHNFQTAVARWTELMMKGAAYSWATS
jgi:hypothetical protein